MQCAGTAQSEAARRFGVSRAIVNAWVGVYRTQGADGLQSRPRGRARRIPDSLLPSILRGCPDQIGLADPLWTWRTIQRYIQNGDGGVVSRWTIMRLLRRWGILPMVTEHDVDTIVPFQSGPMSAGRDRREVFRVHLHRLSPPTVSTGGPDFAGKSILGVSSKKGQVMFMAIEGQLNGTKAIDFLGRVACAAPRTKLLLVDTDRPAYRSRKLQAWLQQEVTRIVLSTSPQ